MLERCSTQSPRSQSRFLLDFLWRPTLPDPDDDMVLETGVNGRADAIVTFNRRHFVTATRQFGLAVQLPAEAIKLLEQRT
jgi:predicted nucleic acid-binding protein